MKFDFADLGYKRENDIANLCSFYNGIYEAEFPDDNERESLANMLQYLQLKEEGWYGNNNYHILLGLQDGQPIAASIIDYLATPNAGVIEFLLVAPEFRCQGVARQLLEYTEKTLTSDADRLNCQLDLIVGEMNDPFKIALEDDNVDPFQRAKIWGKWGFQKLNFPYIQPALSDDQEPVHHLLLMGKLFNKNYQSGIPSNIVKSIAHEYIRWAMRIDNPEANTEYQTMCGFLNKVSSVSVTPLDQYLGYANNKPLVVCKVENFHLDDFDAAITLYQQSFPESSVSVQRSEFASTLIESKVNKAGFNYHLWALRTEPDKAVEGMASFFTFPKIGFGGYLTLIGDLQGKGRLRLLLARMEEQMIRDCKSCNGWLIECEPNTSQVDIFKQVGFCEVAINYRQPELKQVSTTIGDTPVLKLLYKQFGDNYSTPALDCKTLLEAIESIFHTVYHIERPEEFEIYKGIQHQLKKLETDELPLLI
jgi:GNAT superfamily N-acetyltransferase